MTRPGAAGPESAAGGESLQRSRLAPRLLPALLLALLCGCTTHSYRRDDGAMITVKKILGVPYLETKERTTTRAPGSEYRPVR